MRSFQQVVALLFALVAFAFAAASDSVVYDSTVYITSTIYRVNTITASGPAPSSAVANRTSTISALVPSYAASSVKLNATSVFPTGTGAAKPSQPQFTGAAAALNVNAYVAALVAGVGYLAL